MTNTKWQKVKEILDAALLYTPEKRDELVAEACDGIRQRSTRR